MAKYFLLMAGEYHYPMADTGDWISTFETKADAEETITVKLTDSYNMDYIINGVKYDWYKIVDLRDWIENE